MNALADVVARYIRARDEEARLRRERAACVCDFEPRAVLRRGLLTDDPPLRVRSDAAYYATVRLQHTGSAAQAPCWMTIIGEDGPMTEFGEVPQIERIGDGADEGFCASCERRMALHEQLRAAVRRRVSLHSAVIASGRAHLGIPRPPKPVAPAPPPALPREVRATPWDDDIDHPF